MNKVKGVMIRNVTLLIYLVIVLTTHGTPANAQQDEARLKMTVVAFSDNHRIRQNLENKIVNKLLANHYDVTASHLLIENIKNIRDSKLRHKLYARGIRGVLLLRPIDVGKEASISSSRDRISPHTYNTIEEFVTDELQGNFSSRAVVQVSAFIISEQQATSFWSGVIWLDETVESQQEGLDKLAELVLFNLNAARSYMRQSMGLAPTIE